MYFLGRSLYLLSLYMGGYPATLPGLYFAVIASTRFIPFFWGVREPDLWLSFCRCSLSIASPHSLIFFYKVADFLGSTYCPAFDSNFLSSSRYLGVIAITLVLYGLAEFSVDTFGECCSVSFRFPWTSWNSLGRVCDTFCLFSCVTLFTYEGL